MCYFVFLLFAWIIIIYTPSENILFYLPEGEIDDRR